VAALEFKYRQGVGIIPMLDTLAADFELIFFEWKYYTKHPKGVGKIPTIGTLVTDFELILFGEKHYNSIMV
jgi:hypothetical protein